MESIFNQIKKLMQGDQNQPLPPELDWSNMKDGIFDKIQSIEQQEVAPKNSNDSRKRIGLFLILCFELALGLFLIFPKMPTGSLAENQGVTHLSETTPEQYASNNTKKADSITQTQPDAGSVIEKGPKKKIESPEKADYNKVFPASLNNSANEFAAEPVNTPAPSILQIGALSLLPFNTIEPLKPEKIKPSILDIQQMDNSYVTSRRPEKSSDHLILEGGMTYWDEGYGRTKPERAQYETSLASFQLQGYYMKSLKRNYFLMLGLQYQQLESRFEYNGTIPDYKITLKDTIIQVRNNPLTGEQTIIRGDVDQYVEAERRVIHFNQNKLLKASFGIGKSWRFHSFQTDVYLGGALNGLVQNQGRTFDRNSIIDYRGASNSLFQNQLTIDGMLGARLHYYFTPKIGLTTGVQVQRSLMNWSNQEGINFYPVAFGLQLGLSYSL